jgi:hypothetical protein
MSDVKVTRSVDVDALFGRVIQRAYLRMAQAAANEAVGLAPVDQGYLKASMMLQTSDVSYKGNGTHMVAIWKPSQKKAPASGPGPLEYGGYLDNPTGGTETVPAGPRTYPGKGPVKGGKKHGKLFGKHKGTWQWQSYTKQRATNPKYLGTQRKGKPTKGWFNPGVVDALHKSGSLERIAELAADELVDGWNGGARG